MGTPSTATPSEGGSSLLHSSLMLLYPCVRAWSAMPARDRRNRVSLDYASSGMAMSCVATLRAMGALDGKVVGGSVGQMFGF